MTYIVDEDRQRVHSADRAVTDLQTALRLPFRPTGLQGVNDLLRYIDGLKAEIAALKAETTELKAAVMWQPIETAPKDGTHILVYSVDPGYPPKMAVATWRYGNWDAIGYIGQGDCGPDVHPTHWMPLPSPPDTDKKE